MYDAPTQHLNEVKVEVEVEVEAEVMCGAQLTSYILSYCSYCKLDCGHSSATANLCLSALSFSAPWFVSSLVLLALTWHCAN
jgi:hypothetical protein